MTREELEAIEKREREATAGPWSAEQSGISSWSYLFHPDGEVSDRVWRHRDAAFIAAARTDVPALLAEVRRLQAQLSAVEANVREQTDAQCDLVLRRTRLTDREREWATAEIVREAAAAVSEATR